MKNRFRPTSSEPMTIEPERSMPPKRLVEKATSSPKLEPKVPLAAIMAANINRMKIDPEFRDEIAKKIF
jgi:hypothetical protein